MGNTPFHRDLRAALLVLAGMGLGAASGMLLIALVLPQESLAAGLAGCPARLAGTPCPLCGMTTAVYALARGDFSVAQAAHPAVLPLAGMVLWAYLLLFTRHWRRQPGRRSRPSAVLSGGSLCR